MKFNKIAFLMTTVAILSTASSFATPVRLALNYFSWPPKTSSLQLLSVGTILVDDQDLVEDVVADIQKTVDLDYPGKKAIVISAESTNWSENSYPMDKTTWNLIVNDPSVQSKPLASLHLLNNSIIVGIK